jgi:hypothetical protein
MARKSKSTDPLDLLMTELGSGTTTASKPTRTSTRTRTRKDALDVMLTELGGESKSKSTRTRLQAAESKRDPLDDALAALKSSKSSKRTTAVLSPPPNSAGSRKRQRKLSRGSSSAASTRKGPPSERPDAAAVLKRAAGARAWRDAARADVCTPARGFAGKPTDYVYDLKESCTLADPKARAEALKRAKPRARRADGGLATVPSVAATRREVLHLDRVLSQHYNNLMPSNEGPMSPDALPRVMDMMLRPEERLAQPNPELRFAELARRIPVGEVMPGRFTVLSLVNVALKTGLGDVAYPSTRLAPK